MKLPRVVDDFLWSRLGVHRVQALKGLAFGAPSRIEEIAPLEAKRSSLEKGRVNLVVPAVDHRYIFGGISTALWFFEKLSSGFDFARLIVTGTRVPPAEHLGRFSNYLLIDAGEDKPISRGIVSIAGRDSCVLPVGPRDLFVATTWYTAYIVRRLALWQSCEFKQPIKPIVYLIQDYEPGFYPWSSRYLLARSTYECADGPVIAVFNSEDLKEYFEAQGHSFESAYVFEPRMNEVLKEFLKKLSPIEREKRKQILVYGRPSAPRNGFDLIVEALRVWRQRFDSAPAWTLLSVGEPHADVSLGGGMVLRSLGKLGLEKYSEVLGESAIGVSFMISPHPSYPPLEMAHCGMLVLTNAFENKNPSAYHDNIVSVDRFTPERIAQELIGLCRRFDEDPASGWYGKSRLERYLSDEDQFPFIQDIRELLERSLGDESDNVETACKANRTTRRRKENLECR